MRRRHRAVPTHCVAILLAVLAALPMVAFAQGTETRVALVIGNGKYQFNNTLKNPVNDAADIAASLQRNGFTVTILTDAGRAAMEKAVRDFGAALKGPDAVGLFYYSGHGAQAEGQNYLLPVDADIQDVDELRYKAVDAESVLAKMRSAGNKLNIVVLDACRNNPFPGSSRAAEKGLSVVRVKVPESVIVYATDPGSTAADGTGRNSPFTAAFIASMEEPGLDISVVMKRVTSRVQADTGGAQTPWVSTNLTRDFAFKPASGSGSAAAAAPSVPSKPKMTVTKSYGAISVTARTAGTLYLDGVELGALGAGASARLDDVEAGERSLEIRYADGKRETSRTTVSGGGTASAAFAYVVAAPAVKPEGTPTTLRGEINVKGGAFRMGSDTGESDEKPVHEVRVSDFLMMKTEVTQKDYAALMGANPASGYGVGDSYPVYNVSWYDAVGYANKLSERDGLKRCYTISGTEVSCDWSANGWRLPTEAEWEYAARGGTQTKGYTYAGSNDVNAVAWNSGNSGSSTHPVGGKQANELELCDMSGNVWEWCWDWYGSYASGAQTDSRGAASGSSRVFRGGGWLFDASYARTAYRFDVLDPSYRIVNLGFRLVRPSSP